MSLTLARLDEIEVAAEGYTKDPVGFLDTIDPQTVLALVRIARAAVALHTLGPNCTRDEALGDALQDVGLIT